MIYGQIISDKAEIQSNKLQELNKLMMGTESGTHEFKLGKFSGGIIYNSKFPYQKDDFYYFNKKKEVLVLMSGVIYNRDDIIQKLFLNISFKHDPELVYAAFEVLGESFVKELNGDFAIFIYIKQSNSFFLYRDHMGVKPLAFSKTKNSFWFSSDSMSLCKVLYASEKTEHQFLINHLVKYGLQSTSLIANHSLLPSKKVRKVLPGHYLTFSFDTINENKYWYPEKIKEDYQLDYETAIIELKAILSDAVKIRCDKRFIASTHLSGGLDSGIVASLARKKFNCQDFFLGFSWTPIEASNENFDFDERVLVNKLGDFLGITPELAVINPEVFINSLKQWKPVTNLFYEYGVMEKAQENKVNLLFSGWGGDEFVSINDIGVDSDMFFKFQWHSFFKRNSIKKPKQLIRVFLYNIILPALSLKFYTRKKPLSFYSKYLLDGNNEEVRTINDFYYWRSRREIHLRFLNQYHIPERIEDWNIQGNRCGIEYRYPLIDKRIIEFVLKFPSKLLFKNGYGRILMRDISEGLLPEEIRWHASKNDPVRIQAFYELEYNVCLQLMDEMDDFKTNSELSFINFDLLKMDIESFRKGHTKNRSTELFEILIFLKKTHEFLKMYNK